MAAGRPASRAREQGKGGRLMPGPIDPLMPDPPKGLIPVDPLPSPSVSSADFMRALRETRALPGLASLARDLAAWTETVAADSCDTAMLADLEELGRRAHELAAFIDRDGEAPACCLPPEESA